MKTSIAMLILLLILIAFWFWPKTEQSVHLVVLVEQQGELAGQHRALTEMVEELQQNPAIRYRISYLDSHEPAVVLLQRLQQLHNEHPVDVLLGCADSVCVRNLLPWLEEHQRMLLYPGSSEGLLNSRLVVHAGLTANQYLYPGLQWAQQQGRRLLFVGSNSARSYMHLKIIQAYPGLRQQTEVSGYELIGNTDQLEAAIENIIATRPDVVLLDICEWLFLPQVMERLQQLPVKLLSLCVDLPPPGLSGMYYLTSYNHLVDHPENRRLQARWPDAGAWLVRAQWLAAQLDQALHQYRRPDTALLQDFFGMRSGLTAAGHITVDRNFRGSWQRVFLLRQQPSGEQLIWYSAAPIRPLMFPAGQAPSDWQHQLMIYWRNAGGFWRRLAEQEKS